MLPQKQSGFVGVCLSLCLGGGWLAGWLAGSQSLIQSEHFLLTTFHYLAVKIIF